MGVQDSWGEFTHISWESAVHGQKETEDVKPRHQPTDEAFFHLLSCTMYFTLVTKNIQKNN